MDNIFNRFISLNVMIILVSSVKLRLTNNYRNIMINQLIDERDSQIQVHNIRDRGRATHCQITGDIISPLW